MCGRHGVTIGQANDVLGGDWALVGTWGVGADEMFGAAGVGDSVGCIGGN